MSSMRRRRLRRAPLVVVACAAALGVATVAEAVATSDLRVVQTRVLAGKTRVLSVKQHLGGPTGRLPIFVLRGGLRCAGSLCPVVGDGLSGLGRQVLALNVDVEPVGTCTAGFSVVVGTASRAAAAVVAVTDAGDVRIRRRRPPAPWHRRLFMLAQLVPAPFVYAVEARDRSGRVLARKPVLVPGACPQP